jgi:hypothetical protein
MEQPFLDFARVGVDLGIQSFRKVVVGSDDGRELRSL